MPSSLEVHSIITEDYLDGMKYFHSYKLCDYFRYMDTASSRAVDYVFQLIFHRVSIHFRGSGVSSTVMEIVKDYL